MRGYELQQARALARTQRRRAASMAGFGGQDFLALDEEELLKRADLADQSAQGNAVKRRLILDRLENVTGDLAAVARAWNMTPETLASFRRIPLLDASGLAAAIDEAVVAENPETPEPGRVLPASA